MPILRELSTRCGGRGRNLLTLQRYRARLPAYGSFGDRQGSSAREACLFWIL